MTIMNLSCLPGAQLRWALREKYAAPSYPVGRAFDKHFQFPPFFRSKENLLMDFLKKGRLFHWTS